MRMSKQSGQPTGRSLPYKGLEPYTEMDADLMFGRDEEGEQLVYSLQSSRLTILYGAKQVGKTLAERAKAKGINAVVFDRGGFRYQGRVASLAEGAREGGLEF